MISHDVTDGAAPPLAPVQNLPASELAASLRIQGLGAMYAFCFAVCLSLTLGVWCVCQG